MTLHLVTSPDVTSCGDASTQNLPRCKGCSAQIRPHGTSEADFPGTVPSWGDNLCRVCDYEACGKDPADRFIPVERVNYLTSVRAGIEADRRRRGVPAAGALTGRIPLTEFLQNLS